MYAVPSISGLMTSNKRQQRNNKTATTAATNQSIKPKKQTNKQTKYNIKRGFVTGKSHEEKIIHFLQIFTDRAFNPWPGSCCNAQRYGNNDGG